MFKMSAVIGLRGMQCGNDFQLSTNKAGYGNFDDLVYTTRTRRYFLQLEHTDNPDTTKLVHSDLVPFLHQCFESYFSSTQDPTFKELESSEFIIYTNKQLGPKLLQHNRQQREIDVIFETCDTGEIFNFTPDKNKEIDVYTLVEKIVKDSKEFGVLSPPERKVKLKMIRDFLKKLIMFTGQKGQKELDDLITEEIRQHDLVKVSPEMYNMESLYFKMLLETWLRNKKEKVTAETTKNCLQIAKTRTYFSVVGDLSDQSRIKHYGTGIAFSDSEISRLNAELSDKRAVHLRSDAPALCNILLLDCLPISKHIFVNFECLQSHTEELLHAWLGGIWKGLIVFCDSTVQPTDISKTCLGICRRIESVPLNKYFIILTSCSVPQITDFFAIEHEFRFEQLSKKSQEIVLNKKIQFQSCEVTMRSLLQRHGNMQHVLGAELVTDLITGETPVKLGGKLQVKEGCYAHIPLEREIYLQLDVLRNSDSYPDIFAVSGMEERNLIEIVPSDEIVGQFYLDKNSKTGDWIENYNKFKPSRFILLKSKNLRLCFSKLCKKHSGKTLHWLQLQNGCLLWKETRGSIDSLINFVDPNRTRGDKRIIKQFMKRGSSEVNEEAIWDLGERTVLVAVEPDKRKSSTTTQVACNEKLADPTSWVVPINWNDHTRKLQEIKVATFHFDSLVEFLCSAVFPESQYTDINRNLLKQALQNSGNVTVLMDGFDEISQMHAGKATAVLCELMKTEVGRVWVTSRPEKKEKLEKELYATAFTVNNLSQESQKEMFSDPWMSILSSCEEKNFASSVIQPSFMLENKSRYKATSTSFPKHFPTPTTVLKQHLQIGCFQ